MPDVVHNLDHLGDARSRVIQQFRNRPRIDGLIQALMAEVQQLEDAMFLVYFDRLLQKDLATGDLLNKIGEIVGQERLGFNDAQYTLLIQAKIRTNRSDGHHETLVDITRLLVGGTDPIGFKTALKSLEISATGVTINPLVIWHDFLERAKVAGDRLRFYYNTAARANTLIRTSVSGGVTTTTTQRKGSVSGVYGGGVFAGVF